MISAMQVHIWSDVVCPWCYIGKRRFEKALATFAQREQVQVIYRSFQLDPDAPADRSAPSAAVLAAKYGVSETQVAAMMANVTQAAAAEGLQYHLQNTRSGNTRAAHQLLHLARARHLQAAVLEQFYSAYFTAGRSLFEDASLIGIAAAGGLDPQECQRVLREDTYAAAVAADADQARALGVSGVPFALIDDRYAVSGAQSTAVFLQALTQAWAGTHA